MDKEERDRQAAMVCADEGNALGRAREFAGSDEHRRDSFCGCWAGDVRGLGVLHVDQATVWVTLPQLSNR